MRTIAISGLVALAAVLGGVAVPATANAQPATTARPGAIDRPADVALVESGLPSVSCVLTSDCLGAEGSSGLIGGVPSRPTRVARWNGSSWKRLKVAMPVRTTADDLNGVSCRGAASCLVVGDYYTTGSSRALALSYNGTSLRPTAAVPLPKGTTESALAGVSCTTTRNCVALGVADGDTAAFGSFGAVTLIETWNGARWTLHTAAASVGHTAMLVPIVISCATSTFCLVAGTSYSVTAAAELKPYAAAWNGKKLSTVKLPTIGSSADDVLATGVSCASAVNCAVTGANLGVISISSSGGSSGSSSSSAFTEVWNGKTWRVGTVTWPKGDPSTITAAASCYTAHACEVVGESGANEAETSPFHAIAASFNGAAGAAQAVPAPSKGYSDGFYTVSCLPAGSCVALGQTGKTTSGSGALMTGVWNGKAWRLDPGF